VLDLAGGVGGGGDTEVRQQKARRKMQHPIYFQKIQMQHSQHVLRPMKHLKHVSEALAKHIKTLETIVNMRNIQISILVTYV
jgi:hypothetical protein